MKCTASDDDDDDDDDSEMEECTFANITSVPGDSELTNINSLVGLLRFPISRLCITQSIGSQPNRRISLSRGKIKF